MSRQVASQSISLNLVFMMATITYSIFILSMLDADGGCDSAGTARVRSAWNKFREYLPILTGKGFLLKLKGKVYATCVRSCLMHGSETWPMKVEHELKLNCTEMSMIR